MAQCLPPAHAVRCNCTVYKPSTPLYRCTVPIKHGCTILLQKHGCTVPIKHEGAHQLMQYGVIVRYIRPVLHYTAKKILRLQSSKRKGALNIIYTGFSVNTKASLEGNHHPCVTRPEPLTSKNSAYINRGFMRLGLGGSFLFLFISPHFTSTTHSRDQNNIYQRGPPLPV